jgi:hypothetical protein
MSKSATQAAPSNVLLVSTLHWDTFWNLKPTYQVFGASFLAAPLGLLTVAALLPREWTCRLIDCNVTEVDDSDIDWADMVMIGGMITQRSNSLAFSPGCKPAVSRSWSVDPM